MDESAVSPPLPPTKTRRSVCLGTVGYLGFKERRRKNYRHCTPERWFSRKAVPLVQGTPEALWWAQGAGPLAGVRGQHPQKLVNLQLFRGILRLVLAAFTVNLKKKRKSSIKKTA